MQKKTVKKAWPDHLKARIRKLRRRAADRGMDALLITNDRDVRYLTNFKGEDSWALVLPRQVYIISDFRFYEELQQCSPFAKHLIRGRNTTMAQALLSLVDAHRIRKLGVQNDYLTVATRKAIVKAVGASRLVSIAGWLLSMRAVKDPTEIKLLRKAVRIQEQAYREMLKQIEPGMTELQITAILEYHMKWLGADDPAFPTIVGAGPNSSLNHYTPGRARVRRNGHVLIDFGALYRGYRGDMTRVVFLGGVPKKIRKIYPIVREAMLESIAMIRPGVELSAVDGKARTIIERAGYGEFFGHGLGHGIGLDVHESPSFHAKAKGELEPGQVVTVEPGIYLPGVGGVRLEDDILVTEKGHRNLCTLSTDLESVIV